MGIRRKLTTKVVELEPTIVRELRNPEVAANYVRECLCEKGKHRSRLLLRALMDVAKARGISQLAKGSETRRRMIYKALSENANPSLNTLESILEELGLTLEVRPYKKAAGY